MNIGQLIQKNRKEEGLSREDLADRLGLPVMILKAIEEPDAPNDELVAELAKAFTVPVKIFTGEQRKPTVEEKQDAKAAYPAIRAFVIDPAMCRNPQVAREMFGAEPFSLAERNLLLYMSTTALYHFCDRNYSSFAFDQSLSKLHGPLLERLDRQLIAQKLPEVEREERLAEGRGNVFACESIESIAILVAEPFAAELEAKIAKGARDFSSDVDLPFTWEIDTGLMRIVIYDKQGKEKDAIKLLDVKTRKPE
jgi:transcriptional regulator with XRE-family HTH domain